MNDLKYNPDGYLYADIQPRRGEVVWFKPNPESEWRLGKVGGGGISERFPEDYEIETYRGCLRFPGYMTIYRWRYPSLEDQQRFKDEVDRAYGRKS